MEINELRLRLVNFSDKHGLNPKLLEAILNNESNCNGMNSKGVKQRFEPNVYKNLLKNVVNQEVSVIPKKFYPLIKDVQTYVTLCSTSWGIGQIMGYWFYTMGYNSPMDMVLKWQNSEMQQVEDWLNFIEVYNNGNFLKALKEQDLVKISTMYNGKGYARNKYDIKLKDYITK